MSFSYLTSLECPRCKAAYGVGQVHNLCECGSPLLARYDLARLRDSVSVTELTGRAATLWRYHELLPVADERNVVSLGEGFTPLVSLPRYGRQVGVPKLLMKDEGLLPTGTFKARGAAVGISMARELGIKKITMPTNGNAGAAWSAYAARAGIEAVVVMPKDAPDITRRECTVAGARLFLVDGLIGDAGRLAAQAATRDGYFQVSTMTEPYRLEGKKTMGLELVEQLGWQVPDVVLYPTGGGVGLIGIYKALTELRELGWITSDFPRLVAVQSTGCAPIVRAFDAGARSAEPWQDAATVAFGINVARPLADSLILDALRATGGTAIAVDDSEILTAQAECARLDGTFVCPEGAAAFAAVRRLRESGWLRGDENVVVLNTGTGLKYPDTVTACPELLAVGDALPPL